MLDRAPALLTAGCQVLPFDFRAHGGSEGHVSTVGLREARDLDAVLRAAARPRWLALARAPPRRARPRLVDRRPRATFGRRFGFYYRLPVFPFAPLCLQVSEWMAEADLGAIRPGAAARHARIPVLILYGERDRWTTRAEVEALAAELGPHGELLVVPGAGPR